MKKFNEMTNGHKVLSIIGTVLAAPVVVPAIVGTAVAGATTAVASAPVAVPTGVALTMTSDILENL